MYDFDRLDSDDVIGSLELDMWNTFDKNWAQEIDQSWPLRDDYGDVDKSTLKRAAKQNKEHVRPSLVNPQERRNLDFLLTRACMLSVVGLCSLCYVLGAVLACSFTARFDCG